MIPSNLHKAVAPGELGKTLRAQLAMEDKDAMHATLLVATAIRVLEVESVRVVESLDGRAGSRMEDPVDESSTCLVPEGVY